jgi:hypothetical protein
MLKQVQHDGVGASFASLVFSFPKQSLPSFSSGFTFAVKNIEVVKPTQREE